jgi:hypothetical protein
MSSVVRSCYVIDYSGRFVFSAGPDEMWGSIERVDQFERWWGWLGELKVDEGGLKTGSVLRGTVAPPVPYRMRVSVELTHCVAPHEIDAAVTGDLEGEAHLRLRPDRAGTVAEVDWSLEMRQRPMRLAARVCYPLLRWGHDMVVDATVRGFRSQLEGRRQRA